MAGRSQAVIKYRRNRYFKAGFFWEMSFCAGEIVIFLALNIREDAYIGPVPGAFSGREEPDIWKSPERNVDPKGTVPHPDLFYIRCKFGIKVFGSHQC